MKTPRLLVKRTAIINRLLLSRLLLAGLLALPLGAQAVQFTASSQTITISGSTVASGTTFNVGNGYNHDTLAISNGGQLNITGASQSVLMGGTAADLGNAITVDGAGSILSIAAGYLTIGSRGGQNSFTVSNGGTVNGGTWGTTFGNFGTSSTNTAIITGSNSTWTMSTLNLNAGGSSSVSVLAGGKITTTSNLYVGNSSDSNTVTVSGAGSTMQVGGPVSVGNVNGTYNNNALMIGAGGTMNVTSSGTVANGVVIQGLAGATGNKVQIDGGTLTLSTTGSGAPAIDVQNGALIINNGSAVTTPVLTATSGVTSVVNFNGGTLTTKSTTINNGSVFTVGNGTSLATFILNGGNHSFANGLTLSANATLTGTAAVTGTVTASGTISGSLTFGNDVTVNNGATVTGGTFNANVTNSGAITSALSILTGKTLNGSGSVSGATTTSGTIAGALTFGNDVTVNNTGTVTGGTFNANIINNGAITSALSILNGKTLNGSGSVSGATTTSGTIAGALTFGNDVTVNNGGTVTGGTFNANIINNGAITSALSILNGKTLNGSGSVSGATATSGTIAGALTFGNDVTVNNTGTVTGGTFNGNITDNGTISSAFNIQSGKTLQGSGVVSGAVVNSGTIAGGLTFNNNVTNNGTINNGFNVQSGKTLNGSGNVNGAVVNSGTIAGSLTFNNDVTVNHGATASASAFKGNIVANGTITSAVNVQSGKALSGTGSVNNSVTVLAGGQTSAGNGNDTGVLTLDLTYDSGATANFNVSGSSATVSPTARNSGLSYSQVLVTGSAGAVNLQLGSGDAASQRQANGTSNSGVTLEVTLSLADFSTLSANATKHYIATNNTSGQVNTGLDNFFVFNLGSGLVAGEFQTLQLTISGTSYSSTIYYSGTNDRFNGVAHLGDVYVNGQEFAVSYTGNYATNSTIGGNDVALTAVPEPSTWAMVVGGIGMLGFVQRLRRRMV